MFETFSKEDTSVFSVDAEPGCSSNARASKLLCNRVRLKSACDDPRRRQSIIVMTKAAMTWLALRNRSSRQVCAMVSLLLFLTLQVFAASAELHRAIHADASAPNHHCVIASVADGHVDLPIVSSILIAFVGALFFLLPPVRAAIL